MDIKNTGVPKNTMLIVDDIEMNRQIMSKIFQYDFTIITAKNGKLAMELLYDKNNSIDIVLLDLIMPEKDGYAVLKEMREDNILRNIPVIVVSASGEVDGEFISLELGATDFILKPVKPHIARLRVQNILARQENNRLVVQNAMMKKQHEEESILLHLITESKNEYQKLVEFDQLTTIYNRRMFITKTQEMLERNKNILYVLARFDIEKFKIINELLGYKEGDALLKYIAEVLRKRIGENGTYGRLEADVFVICFPYSEENVTEMMEIYFRNMKGYTQNIEIILCFGLYIIHNITVPIDLMIDRATLALRTVKGNYITRYAYYDDILRQKLFEEQEIINEMQEALDTNQFVVYLQPKCSLDTEKIIGAEALVRWNHPKKGLISPGKFIPVFEKNGFIMELDAYIWEETCKLIKKWIDTGKSVLPISVNISRVNLYNTLLCSIIHDLVEKYGIPPHLFELEITESAYTNNAFKLIDVINEFHEYGFTVLMDDFGSGYSSLNMLKDIPVDELKIDLNFLSGADALGRGKNILTSIVGMSRSILLPTIAEGVETKEQADFLRSIDCNKVQGYFFFRPMPIEDFEKAVQKEMYPET